MLNTVTGRILLTAQNQTKSAFSQATKDLRSMATVAASVGAVSGVAAVAVGRAVGEIAQSIAQIPVVMLEMDTAFRDSMITQAKFEHQMKAFNMGDQAKGMEDWADNMQYVLGSSDDQILQTASILARVAREGGVNLKRLTEIAANTGAALGVGMQEAGQRIENASTSAMSAIRLLRQATGKNITNELRERLQILEDYGDYGRIQEILIDELGRATNGLAAAAENGAGYYHQLNFYISEFAEQMGRIVDPGVQSGLGNIVSYFFDVVKALKEIPDGPGHIWEAIGKVGAITWDRLTKAFKQFKEVLLNVNWESVLRSVGQKIGNFAQYIFDAAKEIDWVAIGKILLKGSEVIEKMTSEIFTRGQKEAQQESLRGWEIYISQVEGLANRLRKGPLFQIPGVGAGLSAGSLRVKPPAVPISEREPRAADDLSNAPWPIRMYERASRFFGAEGDPNKPARPFLNPFTGPAGQVIERLLGKGPQPGSLEEEIQKRAEEQRKAAGRAPEQPILAPPVAGAETWLERTIRNMMGLPIEGRQHGGPAHFGQPIIVGEAGPELFVPGTSGRIVPASYGGHPAGGQAIGSTGKEFKEFGNTLEEVNKQLDEFKNVFAQLIEPMKQLVMTPGYGKWARKGGNVFWRGGPGGGGPGGGGQFNPYGVPAGSIPPTSIEAPPMGPGGGGPGGDGGPGGSPQFNPYSAPAGSIPPTSVSAPPMGPGAPGEGVSAPGGKFSGAPSANANSWMSFFMSEMGYDKTTAAAFTAGLMGESGKELNPASFNPKDPGGAYGTAQWVGSRKENLFALARQRGTPWADVRTQQLMWKREALGPYKKAIDFARAGKTPQEKLYRYIGGKGWGFESPAFNNWSQRAEHLPSLLGGAYQEAPKPPVAANPPVAAKPPITQEQAQARSGSYDPLASYKSAQRIYGEAYQNLTPPAPIKPPAADQPTSTRRSRGVDLTRDPVTDSVQPGLAKQRDPMELLQQPRQDVQLGRGKVDLNLKLDRNVNMVRPNIESAENFDLGVSVDRTGQFFARPGDPTYSGAASI